MVYVQNFFFDFFWTLCIVKNTVQCSPTIHPPIRVPPKVYTTKEGVFLFPPHWWGTPQIAGGGTNIASPTILKCNT